MSENPNDKINFYGRQVTRAQLEPFLEFYKADHQLTMQDRQIMASDLEKVRNTSVIWGMLDASIAFFAPTMYRRYTTSKTSVQGETWRKMPVRKIIHRPFLSVAIGTAIYFGSIFYHAKTQIDSQVDKLRVAAASSSGSETESASLKRMLDVWQHMLPSQITFYYLYYWKSSKDPSSILKDPSTMTQDAHEVHYIPPPHEKRGFGGFVAEPEEKHLPHWEKIRKENGFVEPNVSDEKLEDATSEKRNSWEKIRKGN